MPIAISTRRGRRDGDGDGTVRQCWVRLPETWEARQLGNYLVILAILGIWYERFEEPVMGQTHRMYRATSSPHHHALRCRWWLVGSRGGVLIGDIKDGLLVLEVLFCFTNSSCLCFTRAVGAAAVA